MEKREEPCDVVETNEYDLEKFVNYVIEREAPEYVANSLSAGERVLKYIKEEL